MAKSLSLRRFCLTGLIAGTLSLSGALEALAAPSYGLAMHGDLKYGPNFTHFDYVNPEAPKGGTLHLSDLGGFDSLNPFIMKGSSAAGLNALGQGLLYESLMVQSEDEPFSMYGLIAKDVDLAADRSRVTFTLNPQAKWHDGTPITSADVVWTFQTLMQVGSPFFKAYFGDVGTVTADAPDRVTFTIKNPENRELPLVLSQMVVLPKAYWTTGGHDLSKGTLEPPLGSGPYKISSLRPGAQIEYTRVENWWGKDLPVNRGRFNFDHIVYDYYRDQNVSLEAFFAGNYDVRQEYVAKLWATGYDVPGVRDGRIVKDTIPHAQPVGMQAFIYNIRRPLFADPAVREALDYAFDFEWANRQLADSAYTRTDSYFENSDLAASGLPQGRELDLLSPYRGKIPEAVFTTPYQPPKTDGSGNNRANLKRAAEILDAAGWKLGKDGVRVGPDGTRAQFEFIDANPALERWISPFLQNLKKIGVLATVRIIDPAQYQNRMQSFDFDMTTMIFSQSDSPGNEQRDYWTSAKADQPGSRNYIGIKNPAVDELVEKIIAAPTRADLLAASHALDRVLLANHYLIPGWHYPKWRVAWWNKFDRPKGEITKSLGITDTWWMKPAPTQSQPKDKKP